MLTPFGGEIWITDGPEVAVVGFRYPTRMAIIRLSNLVRGFRSGRDARQPHHDGDRLLSHQ